MKNTMSCDYLVIGGGSAGCVLANRLSADPAVRVVLLEAGGPDSHPSLHVPGAIVRNLAQPRYNWGYNTVRQRHMAQRELFWPRGRLLGGSSSINGMIYVRGSRADYDAWKAQGCGAWGYEDVLPYFRKAETSDRGEGPYRGGGGPLHVTRGEPRTPIASAFVDAALECGFARNDDFCALTNEGFGHFDCTIRGGRRWSTATAYLRPARTRANLKVVTGALVSRIVIESGRARGIEALVDGQVARISADAEVVVAAGSINSPQLLMLSGIGPAAHLEDVGITVQLDLPSVGANLHDHIAFKFNLACPLPVSAFKYQNPLRAAAAGARYLFSRRGVLSHTALCTGGFFRSEPSVAEPDLQIHVAIALVPDYGRSLPDRHGFTVYVNQGRPASRGTVRLRSADPTVHPLIDPNYLAEAGDVRTLVQGMRRTREILGAASLRPYISEELQPGTGAQSASALEDAARQRSVSVYHPVGTCRMGGDEASVVDPMLRVRGIEGLRVADASVIPSLVNGNTNAPVIMIAERAADFILNRAKA